MTNTFTRAIVTLHTCLTAIPNTPILPTPPIIYQCLSYSPHLILFWIFYGLLQLHGRQICLEFDIDDPNRSRPHNCSWFRPPSWPLDSWSYQSRTNVSLLQVSVEGLFHHGNSYSQGSSPTPQNTATRNTGWTMGVTNHHCPTILPLNREARISKVFSSWAIFGLLQVVADKSHMNLRLSCTKGTNHKAHVCLVIRWMCKRSTCEEQKPVRFTVIVWFLSMIHAVVETHMAENILRNIKNSHVHKMNMKII